jgi:para-nitrobenzyl esterase
MWLLRNYVFSILACMVAGHAWAATMHTESGWLEGEKLDGLTVFKGVPFAAPPLGHLRWRPPQSVLPWSGVRKAQVFAPACMQKGVSMPGEVPPAVSEDCLYLNVWTPTQDASARLPVLVWIPGGGYSNGSASMPLYWGDQLARKGIIVVTVAYRLGALGFLAHPELTRESARHGSGNYGLMDQIAALQWVQRNIAAFGGDPARVTVAGQSAGAMSVSMLMASPRARGLFQGAIGESGGVFEPVQLAPGYLLAHAERDGEAYAKSLGVSSVAELRKLSAERLLEGSAGTVTHPVIEPDVLPTGPYDAYIAGTQVDVSILIGSNADEARALADVHAVTAAGFADDLVKTFGPLPPAITAAYPHKTDDEAKQARLNLERDLRFGWDMWAWARLQALHGHHPVYYYAFEQQPPFPRDSPYAHWGASHYAELWYVFGHLQQASWPWRSSDRKLADEMVDYWTNFVKSGDPNGKGLPNWPPFDARAQRVMHLGTPTATGTVMNLPSLEAMDAIYSEVRGDGSARP